VGSGPISAKTTLECGSSYSRWSEGTKVVEISSVTFFVQRADCSGVKKTQKTIQKSVHVQEVTC
jgi:hypothetical protein